MHLYGRRAAICILLLVLTSWKEKSKVGNLCKLAASDQNNDYFCTNWLKEASSTSFKTVNDVHMQYTLLCEIFRKIFFEIFCMRNISQNTVCHPYKNGCVIYLMIVNIYWIIYIDLYWINLVSKQDQITAKKSPIRCNHD